RKKRKRSVIRNPQRQKTEAQNNLSPSGIAGGGRSLPFALLIIQPEFLIPTYIQVVLCNFILRRIVISARNERILKPVMIFKFRKINKQEVVRWQKFI
ncbi:MAG: hypothetical protein RBR95_09555, partial [Ignavibacteriaceae bacterium]|nr:hypothetical protein [Ignavibacteriaceae bacterium]